MSKPLTTAAVMILYEWIGGRNAKLLAAFAERVDQSCARPDTGLTL